MNRVFYLIIFIGLSLGITQLPDFDSFKWKNLKSNDISIDYYKKNDIQWCRAYIEVDYSIPEISKILEDKADYPNVFDRITETILYAEDIVHIKLDMPFPWAGRDYIVQYTAFSKKDIKEYTWLPHSALNIPVEKGYVRLPRAAGKWKLIRLGNNRTRIEYIWNGELLGEFPSWALKTAWKEQGNEVLGWLIDYMSDK